ncbi:MAG TPA: S41 family peptidase [Chitinophagaceae bacterium]|nr:S41 family peptidase [Chitinophagaceae bacterium]
MGRGIIAVIVLSVFVSNAFAQKNAAAPGRFYSESELKNDLTILRDNLEKREPNLYLYTPKETLDATFDSLYSYIKKPMTGEAFYKHITCLSSLIKNGHSYILPSPATREYSNKYEKFLPLHIMWIGGRMYADMNCSRDSTIKAGDEIMSINGLPASEIMHTLLIRQVRDGNNETYPVWILNNWFREYYSYIFGHPALFNITYKTGDGNYENVNMPALSKDSIVYYMQQKYADRVVTKKDGQGIFLETNEKLNTAVLTIKTFDGDQLRDDYNQNFRDEMYNYFSVIRKANIQKLVIDLRDNQGGDPENGILLLSFLLHDPFTMVYKGPFSGVNKPLKEAYNGKLYVLINGGSFSVTGMVSSCLEQHRRCAFIGQETGGNKYVLSGDPETLELPATKIECQIATTVYLLRDKPNNEGHGVMPTYTKVPAIDDIINSRDRIKSFAELL